MIKIFINNYRKLLFLSVIDLIFILIYYFRFFGIFKLDINLIFALFLWTFLNYIFGRYSNKKYNKSNQIVRDSFRLFLASLPSILIFKYNNFDINSVSFYFAVLLTSIFTKIVLFYLPKNNFKNIKFSGDKIAFLNFKNTIDETSNCYKYHVSTYKNDIEKNKFNNQILVGRNLKLSTVDWLELYLYRIPSEYIDEKYIKKYFSNNKNIQYERVKRVADILISGFLIILSIPIYFIVAILIKIEDNGPIFYKQERTGKYGDKFEIIKIRSMKLDAELSGPKWSKLNDKRVTKVGYYLRKLRIDEIPQLILVFKGTMSLIGPRPERPIMEKKLIKDINFYSLRYNVKPGISGWAQVNYNYGASTKDSNIKLSYDLFYVKNYSFLLDIVTFFKTLKVVFNGYGSDPLKR